MKNATEAFSKGVILRRHLSGGPEQQMSNIYSVFSVDILLNELSISLKEKIQSLCCMMGKTMSLFGCKWLAINSLNTEKD